MGEDDEKILKLKGNFENAYDSGEDSDGRSDDEENKPKKEKKLKDKSKKIKKSYSQQEEDLLANIIKIRDKSIASNKKI